MPWEGCHIPAQYMLQELLQDDARMVFSVCAQRVIYTYPDGINPVYLMT